MRIFYLILLLLYSFPTSLSATSIYSVETFEYPVVVQSKRPPTAKEIDRLLQKLTDPNIKEALKVKIASYAFYHSDILRKGVMLGQVNHGNSLPQHIETYLNVYKPKIHESVISKMGIKYKNKYGEFPKTPIIPFSFNDLYSDDDIITGSGEVGRRLEAIFNESLSEVIETNIGIPMTTQDRARIDVNGLAWNMTEDGAYKDFHHPEKYINPKSGNANKNKLIDGAKKGKTVVYEYDSNGRAYKLSADDAVKSIQRLDLGEGIKIPGIDPEIGSASMSDFLRIAEIHQIRPNGKATVEEIITFKRNQKYSPRAIEEYEGVFKDNPELSRKFEGFITLSGKVRKAQTVKEIAELMQDHYNVKIISSVGEIDYDVLTKIMLKHQNIQLTEILPQMISAVTQSEAFKIAKWLKSASKADRNLLRKQMALTYAPLEATTIDKIALDIDLLEDLSDADKKFIKNILINDSRQIRRYADVLQMNPVEFVAKLKPVGDNWGIVSYISKDAKVKPFVDTLDDFEGGKAYREFLESQTAKALNLDILLNSPVAVDINDTQAVKAAKQAKVTKFVTGSMMLASAGLSYVYNEGKRKDKIKASLLATFEIIPFVSPVLRFSELEYRLAVKDLMMELPPLALINIGTEVFKYTANTVIDSWTDDKMNQIAETLLLEMTDEDFEKSEISNQFRLKNREELLTYLDEVSPGLGNNIVKFSSLIAPKIDAKMVNDKRVQDNEAALVTCLWFTGFNYEKQGNSLNKSISDFALEAFSSKIKSIVTNYDIEALKARVYEEGIPSLNSSEPYERVGARFILDNKRIRKEYYYVMLNDLINLVEKLYNEKKKNENLGYVAIVFKTMQELKVLYEGAPEKIKNNALANSNLSEEYRSKLEYLTNYKNPKNLSDLEVDREMSVLLSDFVEFIRKLALVVDISLEKRYLNLQTQLYGGSKSFEETNEVLLGSEFRLGISAQVNPLRKNQNWSIYYYTQNQSDNKFALLDSKSLQKSKFNPGNDGNWVIEAPEEESFITINSSLIDEYFSEESAYIIIPILAFGDWTNPVSEVGFPALQNPTDYANLFTKDKVAFLGDNLMITVARGEIESKIPFWIYKDDKAEIKTTLKAPSYLKDEQTSLEYSVYAFDTETKQLPKFSPQKHKSVVVSYNQSITETTDAQILFLENAKSEKFYITVKATIKNIKEEYQPNEKIYEINYLSENRPNTDASNDDNGNSKETDNKDDTTEGEDSDDEETAKDENAEAIENSEMVTHLSDLEQLYAQIQDIQNTAKTQHQNIKTQASEIRSQIREYSKRTKDISKQIEDLIANSTKESDAIADEMKALSTKMIEMKSKSEELTLSVCETYNQLKGTTKIKTVDKLIKNAKNKNDKAHEVEVKARDLVGEMRVLKSKAENLDLSIQAFKIKADQLIKSSNALIEESVFIEKSVETLNLAINALTVQNNQSQETAGSATNIMDLITNEYESLDKPKALRGTYNQSKKIFKRINGSNNKTGNLNDSGLKTRIKIASNKQDNYADKTKLVAGVQLLETKNSGQYEAQILEAKTDILATHDAGKLYYEPIAIAVTNSEICIGGIENQHSIIAQSHCAFLGDRGTWSMNRQKTVCKCKSGYFFNAKQTMCLTRAEYEQEQREIAERRKRNSEALVSILTDLSNAVKDKNKTTPPPPQPAPTTQTNTGGQKEQHLRDIVVSKRTVTINVWDHGCEDGDKITLRINGITHLSNYNLVKKKKSFQVTLPSGNNTLELIADDSGTDCPAKANKADTVNSAAISVSDATKGGYQTWLLKQGSSSRANFIVKQ
ncbi:MAG: hypothetical protein EVB11_06775 [Winogradskyella sp.]|nr:MAG: hypothetical protein EVB11_06775 [Winogradskyella sp.]